MSQNFRSLFNIDQRAFAVVTFFWSNATKHSHPKIQLCSLTTFQPPWNRNHIGWTMYPFPFPSCVSGSTEMISLHNVIMYLSETDETPTAVTNGGGTSKDAREHGRSTCESPTPWGSCPPVRHGRGPTGPFYDISKSHASCLCAHILQLTRSGTSWRKKRSLACGHLCTDLRIFMSVMQRVGLSLNF